MRIYSESQDKKFNFGNSDYDESKFLNELRSSDEEERKEAINDYLEFYYEISEELVEELKTNFNLKVENLVNYIYLINNSHYYFLLDTDIYDKWCRKDEVSYKINSLSEFDILEILEIEEDDVYISGWGCRVKELQEKPSTVYHYTTEEAWEEIQESGELSEGRGSLLGSNTDTHGIFTSLDREEYAIGKYGNVCLQINLPKFKKDMNLDKLDLSPEPDVLEMELINMLKYKIDKDLRPYEISPSFGLSSLTVIVSHAIPIEYVKAINI